MRVLLIAMPDTASNFDRVMKVPNLGLASIAAAIPDHEVRILDLVLRPKRVLETVRRELVTFRPEVIGLSAMTFQYATARAIAARVRELGPAVRILLGGYHATLMEPAISSGPDTDLFDAIVCGEGEEAVAEILRRFEAGQGLDGIPGVSHHGASGFIRNGPPVTVDLDRLALPRRSARAWSPFGYFGKSFDTLETSRGCPLSCRFCCIRRMYGPTYRRYSEERVIADLAERKAAGVEGIFFVDDHINLDLRHFVSLCDRIAREGLNTLEYISQMSLNGLDSEEVVSAMARAGFRAVFLGIENLDPVNQRFLNKSNPIEKARVAVANLHQFGIAAAGGLILGNPEDGREEICRAFRTARDLGLDHAIIWCLTPYPGTEVREDLIGRGLVTNLDDFSLYNGFTCNVRTQQLTHTELHRLICVEGIKYYFRPELFRQALWNEQWRFAPAFLANNAEYVRHFFDGRLFPSRHTL